MATWPLLPHHGASNTREPRYGTGKEPQDRSGGRRLWWPLWWPSWRFRAGRTALRAAEIMTKADHIVPRCLLATRLSGLVGISVLRRGPGAHYWLASGPFWGSISSRSGRPRALMDLKSVRGRTFWSSTGIYSWSGLILRAEGARAENVNRPNESLTPCLQRSAARQRYPGRYTCSK